jgi:hypothetical protein
MNKESRQFYRIPATVPFFVRPLALPPGETPRCTSLAEGFEEPLRKKLMRSVNISGAGVYFTADKPFERGQMIEVRMMLEPVCHGLVILHGQVLRVEPIADGYGIAMNYLGMDDRTRELIAQFVLARERQLIKEKRIGWL